MATTHSRVSKATARQVHALIETHDRSDGVNTASVIGVAVDLLRVVLIESGDISRESVEPTTYESNAERVLDRLRRSWADPDLAKARAEAARCRQMARTALDHGNELLDMVQKYRADQEDLLKIINRSDLGDGGA